MLVHTFRTLDWLSKYFFYIGGEPTVKPELLVLENLALLLHCFVPTVFGIINSSAILG